MHSVSLRRGHRGHGVVVIVVVVAVVASAAAATAAGVVRVMMVRVLTRVVGIHRAGSGQVHVGVTDPDGGRGRRVESPRRMVGVVAVGVRRRKHFETTQFIKHGRLLISLLLLLLENMLLMLLL